MILKNSKIKKPQLVFGIGELNFGNHYRQGYRVYTLKGISPTLLSTSHGISGYSPLVLVKKI